tara:strand:- start:1709 stop:3052 length:1344 start_codon:yes stop_codon:yes gene_type:complete
MFQSQHLQEKWQPVLEHPDLPEIGDPYRRAVTSLILENQEKAMKEDASFLSEAAPYSNAGGSMAGSWDPILISLIRRAMPQLIAYDICGVQPMSGPTGLIFAMKARVDDNATIGSATEILFNEADTTISSSSDDGDHTSTIETQNSGAAQAGSAVLEDITSYDTADGMATADGEALGDASTNDFMEASFTIDKVTVTARTRAMKAEYTMELAQDLKAIHGLDTETELANILSTELLAEINREVVRTIYTTAQKGAEVNVTDPGKFDLDTDSNGRWSVEKFKGLLFQIERDANAVGQKTRRGKGNIIICSADVASALNMAGMLDVGGGAGAGLNVDDTATTFAGTMGRFKVYVDPYSNNVNANQFYVVGYKGSNPYDAGIFYCPYVPLQMVRAVGENSFQPKIGFKTRYGMVANPFATSAGTGAIDLSDPGGTALNEYYRRVQVTNLM